MLNYQRVFTLGIPHLKPHIGNDLPKLASECDLCGIGPIASEGTTPGATWRAIPKLCPKNWGMGAADWFIIIDN